MSDERTKALFQELLDLDGSERARHLERACAGDLALRDRVCGLLAAHEQAGTFLETPATWMARAIVAPAVVTEKRGDRIGVYELVERLGEGGFGTVWRARQTRPVTREVALKIVKLGMDTAEVVRRFQLEQDALARMDHPQVAKVLDAGATADGRPWFSMELVDGEPITDYCDRRGLDARARLELFADVCRAIQHAHHKGIVHRDVKPSNVMVTTRDGRPLPRVIDFGIAKALDRTAAEHTLFTAEHRLMGTPEYMSPEQVESWGADVDARTDVYSLGVLLYELVTGSRPFDLRRIGKGRFDEVLRCIREVDPERPSTRIAALVPEEAAAVAEARRTALTDLRRQVRGDVDWIVMRALEKDRRRRYATPAELAADVERCLRDEPVTAGPPGLGYRLRKLARRHRMAFTLVGLAAVSLVGGSAFALHGMWNARVAEAAERAARRRAELGEADARRETLRTQLALDAVERLLVAADPRTTHGPGYTVREMLEEFADGLAAAPLPDPLVEARLRAVLGRTYRQLGEVADARTHLTRALEIREAALAPDHPDVADSRTDLAWLLHDEGAFEAAADAIVPVVDHWRRVPDEPVELAAALGARAVFLSLAGRHGAALATIDETLALCREHLGEDHADTARTLARRAQIRFTAGHGSASRDEMEQALATLQRHVPAAHPELLTLEHNLGVLEETDGRHAEAEVHYRSSLAGRLRLYGAQHPAVASSKLALGWSLHRQGKSKEAATLLEEARATFAAALGEDHVHVARAMLRLGDVRGALGETDAAIATLRRAVAALDALPHPPAEELAAARSNLAIALHRSGDDDAAIAELEAALAECRLRMPRPHPTKVGLLVNLGRLRVARGDGERALEVVREAAEIAHALWSEQHPTRAMVDAFLATLRAAK